jgi:hypothetical protein
VWLGLGFAADALEQRHAALRKERLEVYMQVRRSPVYSVVSPHPPGCSERKLDRCLTL